MKIIENSLNWCFSETIADLLRNFCRIGVFSTFELLLVLSIKTINVWHRCKRENLICLFIVTVSFCLLIECNSSLFKRHKNVNNLYKLAKKVSNEGEPPEFTNLVGLASHVTWRWVKMASKANKISDALNSARASNLNSVVSEEIIRALFEEYLSDSEEEEVF